MMKYLPIFFVFLNFLNISKISALSTSNDCPNPSPNSCASLKLNVTTWTEAPFHEDPDANRDTAELIQAHGYKVGVSKVQTRDNYILTLYRIRESSKSPWKPGKPVILIQHGLLGASHDWVLNPPERNLPYMMADAGYDVFIGNNRGTTYSQEHTNMTTSNPEFWNYSWHEMGFYDVPAFMYRIKSITGQEKIFYVGLSQGTSQFLVMLTERPQMNERIHLAALLAPVAFLNHSTSYAFKVLSEVQPLTNAAFGVVNGQFGIPKWNEDQRSFACSFYPVSRAVCATVMFAIAGFNECEMNCTRLPVYVAHDPDSSSFKSFWHYVQLIKSGDFRRYDTREISNDALAPPPKDYDLNKITAPISLFSGSKDSLADPIDVQRLADKLAERGVLRSHIKNDYEHLDFYWGLTVKEKVFDVILKQFNAVLSTVKK